MKMFNSLYPFTTNIDVTITAVIGNLETEYASLDEAKKDNPNADYFYYESDEGKRINAETNEFIQED